MNGRDVYAKLNEIAPFVYAADWDNSGVQVGSLHKEIHRVMLALDPTEDVIRQAMDAEVDMLITHHPLLFRGIKTITEETPEGRKVLDLIQNNICCVSMHTNADATILAEDAVERMGLEDAGILEHGGNYCGTDYGYGRIGELPAAMPLEECITALKRAYNLAEVHVYGNNSDWIKKIAIMPGSGADAIAIATEAGADLYITGDIKHHVGIDATEQGLTLVDATHYGLEKVFPTLMRERLENCLRGVEVLCAREMGPFVIR